MPAPSLRLIEDTLRNAEGAPAAEVLEISWRAGATYDGFTLAAGKIFHKANNGIVSIYLAPGSYTVRYQSSGHQEDWIIPQSAGPFSIADVKQP